jgi:16S rRNA G966 N2-methylase RsmD
MQGIFNNPDLYPTPEKVIFRMLAQYDVNGKTILEPSAGKGDLLEALTAEGANVLYCEVSEPLQCILNGKGRFMCADFLELTSDKVSHINAIFMNPPFSKGVAHILHAYSIAPDGCTIVALCNSSNIKNDYSKDRKELKTLIENYGNIQELGNCFEDAERSTAVEVAMITIKKPGENSKNEFEGFFMDDEPEKDGETAGLMPYNVVRELVNRYVQACKIYEEQLQTAVKLNNVIGTFFSKTIAFTCTNERYQINKEEFKKDLQREGWRYIFNKLDLEKDMTAGVRETINKFVEQQKQVPFTMRNIYKMLEIIIATRGQTMDKAIEEAFDKITNHHFDNRYNVPGWKTNLHYLVGKKFILPNMCYQDQRWYKGESKIQTSYGGYFYVVEDLNKALAFITGISYNSIGSLSDYIRYPYKVKTKDSISFHTDITHYNGALDKKQKLNEQGIECEIINCQPIYGEWFEWGYFKVKAFKKGSMHFEWLDDEIWGKFNQRVAKIKGFPLFEPKAQTAYQKRNAGQKAEPKTKEPKQAKILFEVKF